MVEHVPQRVVIAGGHGQISLILAQLLVDHGDQVISLLHNPNHSTALQALGVEPVDIDLTQAEIDELKPVFEEASAIVFGAETVEGVEASARLAYAAEVFGVRRFIQISQPGMPLGSAGQQSVHDRANLDWTILRLGFLTDEEPTGTVTLFESPLDSETALRPVSVSDVATVVLELLEEPGTAGKVLHLADGHTPIMAAVSTLANS